MSAIPATRKPATTCRERIVGRRRAVAAWRRGLAEVRDGSEVGTSSRRGDRAIVLCVDAAICARTARSPASHTPSVRAILPHEETRAPQLFGGRRDPARRVAAARGPAVQAGGGRAVEEEPRPAEDRAAALERLGLARALLRPRERRAALLRERAGAAAAAAAGARAHEPAGPHAHALARRARAARAAAAAGVRAVRDQARAAGRGAGRAAALPPRDQRARVPQVVRRAAAQHLPDEQPARRPLRGDGVRRRRRGLRGRCHGDVGARQHATEPAARDDDRERAAARAGRRALAGARRDGAAKLAAAAQPRRPQRCGSRRRR